MKLKLIFATCLALGVAAGACGNIEEDGGTSSPTADSQMALSADLLGASDVTQFKFKLTRVDCYSGDKLSGFDPITATKSLENLALPGGNETFEGGPYDEGYDAYSEHRFADNLFNVPYGCYDVKAIPLDKHGDLSEDCAIAKKSKQKAIKSAFTEIHLISQCRGEARRTVDVVASLNHPPEVTIKTEKFMCAGSGVRVCATASDPDDDPLRFKWVGKDNGCFLPIPTTRPRYDKSTGEWTQCVLIPSHRAETKNYKVVVKDLAWDDKHHKRVPIEKLLEEQENYHPDHYFDPDKSRAEAHFQTHALDECIPGAKTFIGLTLGADLDGPADDTPNEYKGMSRRQAKKLAKNTIEFVNPNKHDYQPWILVVQDDNHNNEDRNEGKYIKRLLKAVGYKNVVYLDEPTDGLKSHYLVPFDVVWFTNPGHPIDDEKTYMKLRQFSERGGGVVISGDDANQNKELVDPLDMSYFSFMEFKKYKRIADMNANGTQACGRTVDNWGAKAYKVKFKDTALTEGITDMKFPYANDIDRNKRLYKGEILVAYTEGLTCDHDCLGAKIPVITAIPSPLTLN